MQDCRFKSVKYIYEEILVELRRCIHRTVSLTDAAKLKQGQGGEDASEYKEKFLRFEQGLVLPTFHSIGLTYTPEA